MKVLSLLSMAIAFTGLLFTGCASEERDPYLRSLKLRSEIISPIDSVDLEQYDIYRPHKVEKFGDWMAIFNDKGDFNVMFINPMEKDSFGIIRRGRGPGEMSNASSFHSFGGNGRIYDWNSSMLIEIEMSKTLSGKKAVLDTVLSYNESFFRPYYLCSAKNGVVSSILYDEDNSWYGLYSPEGDIISKVARLGYAELKGLDKDKVSSVNISSSFTSNSIGDKFCVVSTVCAAISFSELRDNKLTEIKRYEESVLPSGGRDATACFEGVCADDRFVYALYSGRKMSDKSFPSYECNNLVVYDWNGNPVRRYHLSRNVFSVSVYDDRLYCVSTYPSTKIFVYHI